MTTASQASAKIANRGRGTSSPERNDLRWFSAMLDVAKRIWPTKTAWHLASETKVTERAAQFWLAGKTGMTMAAARELMRGPHGFEFLVAYVGEDCEAPWFQRCKLAHEVGVTAGRIRTEQKRIEKLRAQQAQLAMKLEE